MDKFQNGREADTYNGGQITPVTVTAKLPSDFYDKMAERAHQMGKAKFFQSDEYKRLNIDEIKPLMLKNPTQVGAQPVSQRSGVFNTIIMDNDDKPLTPVKNYRIGGKIRQYANGKQIVYERNENTNEETTLSTVGLGPVTENTPVAQGGYQRMYEKELQKPINTYQEHTDFYQDEILENPNEKDDFIKGLISVEGGDFDPKKKERLYKDFKNYWDYLRNRGLSNTQSAALLGNAYVESLGNSDEIQKGGDYAKGLFQMHGLELANYKKWLINNNKTHSGYSQLDYVSERMIDPSLDWRAGEYNRIKQELKNGVVYKKDVDVKHKNDIFSDYDKYSKYYTSNFKNYWQSSVASVNGLTEGFVHSFERAGTPHMDRRKRFANLVYNTFK